MLSVVTNNGALVAQAALSSVDRGMQTSMERLSTGKHINAARDDAAGVAIASRLTSNIRGINQGIRNAMDAQALLDTAEGAMQETEALLQRLRELAVQAANDTNSSDDRSNLDAEAQQLQAEIDRIASTTSWAGQNLLDGTFTNKGFQVGGGTAAADMITTSITGVGGSDLGLGRVAGSSYSTSTSYSVDGTVATSSYPGQNNSNDVIILSNWPGNASIPYVIMLDGDTTNGMIEKYSTASSIGVDIDSSLAPSTKIEILGIDYTVPQGTPAEKLASLASMLQADGISTTSGTHPSNGKPLLHVNGATLSDYQSAFGTEKLLLYADPLDIQDGLSNDAEYNSSQDVVSLVSSYSKPNVNTLRSPLTDITTPRKVGSEFQVNTYTAGDQGTYALSGPGGPDPIISTSSNGNYLVTWSSDGQDGSGEGIFSQLFSSDNVKIGGEIAVNSNTSSAQTHPDTAFFSDGSFIVTWETSDSDNTGIASQVFSASGAKIGTEYAVNTTVANAQRVPSITVLADDTALITFSSYQHGGNADYDIIGQRITKDGNRDGAEFRINIDSNGNESESDIVQLSNGNVVVAYTDYSGGGTVHAQIISTGGSAIGGEINIDGPNSGLVTNGIDIVALKNGGFAVTWQTWNSTDNSTEVFIQVLDNSGNSLTSKMSLATSDSITFPSIAADQNGGFAVSWTASASDGSQENVYAQTFASNGTATSSKFLLNSYSSGVQSASDIEFHTDGNLIAAWISENQDGDGKGIFGQVFNTESTSNIDLSSNTKAKSSLTALDTALQTLNAQRSSLGALSNRLDHTIANNTNAAGNISIARGRIEDADFATETTNLAKYQILQQAATAMLAQANASKQNVLTLLQD